MKALDIRQTMRGKKMCRCKQAHEYIPLSRPLLPLFMTTKRKSEREAYFESTYEIFILQNYNVLEDFFFTVQDK